MAEPAGSGRSKAGLLAGKGWAPDQRKARCENRSCPAGPPRSMSSTFDEEAPFLAALDEENETSGRHR